MDHCEEAENQYISENRSEDSGNSGVTYQERLEVGFGINTRNESLKQSK